MIPYLGQPLPDSELTLPLPGLRPRIYTLHVRPFEPLEQFYHLESFFGVR